MKNINYKNGFTLIELLAIIVILAIIAVIAVPKILNIIDGVKRDSIKSSARGYVDAVKKQIVVNGMDDTVDNDIREGTKTVEELGNIYGVKVDGEIPSGESTVTFVDGYIQSYSLYIGDYIVIMEDNVIYVNKLGFIDVAYFRTLL